MAWYNDLTYIPNTEGIAKPLPILCCNESSCNFEEPAFMQRPPFINITVVKYNEIHYKLIFWWTVELKKWKKAQSKAFWIEQNIEADIPNTLLMSNKYFIGLAKTADSLINSPNCSKIKEFSTPWYDLNKYIEELFAFLYSSSFGDFSLTKSDRKDALNLARESKKPKVQIIQL